MDNFFDKFKLNRDRENINTIVETIHNGVVFRGTNLWVLIFAIFVASLGLNVNSTAVVIGAMLISPLMGPIMGLGLAVGVNDLALLRKSFYNYGVASGAALATSTIFFLISPLNQAHSEILARTSPNIYDVLIALFGGFAGIIATSSKTKGNVIPGVAIATALMPPLCTAGYGLATLKFNYFFGAAYLFIINTVFIAFSTFVIVRFLKFPFKHLQDSRAEKVSHRIIWGIVMITLIPSIYFGYDLVRQDRFSRAVDTFIENETHLANDYLLNKKVDARHRTITLVYGGREILPSEILQMRNALKKYNLNDTKLDIKQGFAYLTENESLAENENTEVTQLNKALELSAAQNKALRARIDSLDKVKNLGDELYKELKAQYPELKTALIQPGQVIENEKNRKRVLLVLLDFDRRVPTSDRTRIDNWLKAKLASDSLKLVFE